MDDQARSHDTVTMMKTFRLRADEIRQVAPGHGACFASDQITVSGQRVGFAYREEPDDDRDSGWRFFAGTETQEYADEASNFEIYDVNTIANYDPEIVPFLGAPVGSSIIREPLSGPLRPDTSDQP
jgi:hypothetical protein